MFRGTGTHFGSPLLGDERSGGGLYEEVPADILSRLNRATVFLEFIDLSDFGSGTNWTVTAIVAGTASSSTSTAGGALSLDPGAVDNQGLGSVQYGGGGAAYFIASTTDSIDGMDNRIISCSARMNSSDFSASDWFFGLAGFDTTLMGTTGALLTTGADNCVGWQHAGESLTQGGVSGTDGNDVRMVSAGGGVANLEATLLSAGNVAPVPAPANAAVDNVFIEFGFKIIGTRNVEFYRNGRLVHRRLMSNALASGMVISFANVNVGGAGGQNIILADYVMASASR